MNELVLGWRTFRVTTIGESGNWGFARGDGAVRRGRPTRFGRWTGFSGKSVRCRSRRPGCGSMWSNHCP